MNTENTLLSRLPKDVYDRMRPGLEKISVPRGTVLHHPGDTILFLHFPLTCMISVTITTSDGRTVEVGVVGSREVAGINAFMGGSETSTTEYVVQLPGDVLRIEAAPLKEEFDRNTDLRDVMLKYTQSFIAQISQNVACNRLHGTEQRFARWLLETRDRVASDEFLLTQDFMAEMLGVRRVTVTLAAHQYKDKGVIEYARGIIKIKNLALLKASACECYEVLVSEQARLLR